MKERVDELNMSNFNTVIMDDTSIIDDSAMLIEDDSVKQLRKNFEFEKIQSNDKNAN